MKSIKRPVVALFAALAAVAAASPAWAVAERAQDQVACSHEQQSPSCRPDFPGLQDNHNETLVRDRV